MDLLRIQEEPQFLGKITQSYQTQQQLKKKKKYMNLTPQMFLELGDLRGLVLILNQMFYYQSEIFGWIHLSTNHPIVDSLNGFGCQQ